MLKRCSKLLSMEFHPVYAACECFIQVDEFLNSHSRSPFNKDFISLLQVESLSLILAVVAAKYSAIVILMSIACQAFIFLLLLVLAMTVPVDFTKWTALFLVLFLVVFTFSIATLLSQFSLKLEFMSIVYSIIIVTILSTAMLLNLQVLFNGAIFELYPDDFILGSILMFADVM